MTIIKTLVGKRLLDAISLEQGVRMLFDDGTILIAFNKYTIIGDGSLELRELNGVNVNNIIEELNKIMFYFNNSTILQISLLDEDCTGPEFMELILPTGEIIVWN